MKSLSQTGIGRLIRQALGNDHLALAALAIVIGVAVGGVIVGFREVVDLVQWLFYGDSTERLGDHLVTIPWWRRLAAPVIAGLLAGVFIMRFMPGGRPQGIADVIEASALRGGAMHATTGVRAAIASAISLGGGASVGREGPAVHLGASLASSIAKKLGLTRSRRQTILGCGVAAAVAASFNAPLAGALFANELVIGHYALRAFAPVVISSVAATAISRLYFGDFPAFALIEDPIASFWEFPAFIGLGVIAGIAAIVMMEAVFRSHCLAQKTGLPMWTRPMIGGLMLGLMGLALPQVIGVGYGTTEDALLQAYSFWFLVLLVLAKIAATAISIGWGFAGGMFSPALVVGALLGAAYGIVATSIFPDLSSGVPAYTVVGMGAFAAAIMGAPISTTLIIFEMTSNYTLTLGVMLAVVVASEISHQSYARSFFHRQLKTRGIDLRQGVESEITQSVTVSSVMRHDTELVSPSMGMPDLRSLLQKSPSGELFVVKEGRHLLGTITLADMSEFAFDRRMDGLLNASDVARTNPPVLCPSDDLQTAIDLVRKTGETRIAVVNSKKDMKLLGCVFYRDMMTAYNRALVSRRHEELGRE